MSAISLYAHPSPAYAAKVQAARAVLTQAATDHAGHVVQANSLGVEDMVITHLIDTQALPVPLFVLDTGRLHGTTLALLAQLQAERRADSPVRVYGPDHTAAAAFDQREGPLAMRRSVELRRACCQLRKLEPLARALAGHTAWITGLRAEQSEARAGVQAVDASEVAHGGRTKFSPLHDWTLGDVWHYVREHGVATHPLHDQFYPSIGCEPCTRAVAVGEDFRAGRWWWEQSSKECGLHGSHAVIPIQPLIDVAPATTEASA
jgi:phosphoadenosine phosphosulfate reductase